MKNNANYITVGDKMLLITNEDIDDIMVNAFEGGITYWCARVKVVGDYLGQYSSEQISRDGQLKFMVDEPFDDADTLWYTLDKPHLLEGIRAYFEEYVKDYEIEEVADEHYGNVLRLDMDMCDAETSDIIIQLALFDDVIYG